MRKMANFLWIDKQDDVYTVLMTPELQDDLGTVGYVDFAADKEVDVDDTLMNVEASKTVLDVATPLAGTIVEKNTAAEDEPTLLNSTNPAESWIVKLTNVDEAAFNALADAE